MALEERSKNATLPAWELRTTPICNCGVSWEETTIYVLGIQEQQSFNPQISRIYR